MRATWIRVVVITGVAAASVSALGCTDFTSQGNLPHTLVVQSITATSGADDSTGSFLLSDVETFVDDPPVASIFNDTGSATLALLPRNPVGPAPTAINAVTIYRYRITFRRSDGRNTPGVDVPHPVDGGMTVTVQGGGTATASFEFIRHTAKQEAPLRALRRTAVMIATTADITFFGRDQAGHDVSATGSISVTFGDFGDPD